MKLLKANALLFQCHYPIGCFPCYEVVRWPSATPHFHSRSATFHGIRRENADMFLHFRSYSYTFDQDLLPSLFPSRSSVPTRSHAYANLFRRCISARVGRLCVRQYIRVYVCTYPRGPDIPRGACAYEDPYSPAWSRLREDHKLNDVNALSTLYRNERRRHTTSSPRVHHSLSVTATLPPNHHPDPDNRPPCLDAEPDWL